MSLRNDSIVAMLMVAALTGCATSSLSNQDQPRDVASENLTTNLSSNSSSASQQGAPPFAAGLPMPRAESEPPVGLPMPPNQEAIVPPPGLPMPMTGSGMPDGVAGLPMTTSGQEDPRVVGLPITSSDGMPPAVGLPVPQDPTAVNLSCSTEKTAGGATLRTHVLLDRYSPEIKIEFEAINGAKVRRLGDIVSRILRPTDDSYLFVNKAAGFVMFLSGHLADKSFPGHMNMIVDGKRISKSVRCKAWKEKSK